MRRKTDKNILKKSIAAIVLSVFVIVIGVYLIIKPYVFPLPDYNTLQTKEVTISVYDIRHGYRVPSTAYIRTTDGETYDITGTYDDKQLQELLTKGKTVTIKWSKVPISKLVIEELNVDGERIVTYDNDKVNENDKKYLWIAALWPIILGVGGILYVRYDLRRNRENVKRE